jgi:hypothetical protein
MLRTEGKSNQFSVTGIERLMTTREKKWSAYAVGAASAGMAMKFATGMHNRHELLRLGLIRELHSSWYEVGGLRMHVRTAGQPDAPPIVLIHGLGVSSSYFVPFAERLATRFRVYFPNLPGHGYSASPLGIAGLAKALLNWMDLAGIKRGFWLDTRWALKLRWRRSCAFHNGQTGSC